MFNELGGMNLLERRRVRTGIEGLDYLLSGGLPEGRTYLVAGEAGTGKTIFALQYVYKGVEYEENGVYVTIDERPEHIVEDALTIGWDLEKLIDENKLMLVELTPYFASVKKINAEKIVEDLKGFIDEIKAKRLVIDPIAPLIIRSEEAIDLISAEFYVRNYIRSLIFSLDELNVTTIATSEIPTGTNKLSRYGVEEFLASGVIVLSLRRVNGTFSREIYIRKMRGVEHNMDVHTFIIQKGRGIVISL